jgi:hypothetical protein
VEAKTTRLTRKTPLSDLRDVSHALVLAAGGRRDAAWVHLGHDRPKRRGKRRCLVRARPMRRWRGRPAPGRSAAGEKTGTFVHSVHSDLRNTYSQAMHIVHERPSFLV